MVEVRYEDNTGENKIIECSDVKQAHDMIAAELATQKYLLSRDGYTFEYGETPTEEGYMQTEIWIPGSDFFVRWTLIKEETIMNHPDSCYSHDMENNCTIVKWGESGYYLTDYPKGGYTDEIIDEINAEGGISRKQRKAMEFCSMCAQSNPNFNWEETYAEFMQREEVR